MFLAERDRAIGFSQRRGRLSWSNTQRRENSPERLRPSLAQVETDRPILIEAASDGTRCRRTL
jgi:hypothetical protein